MQPGCYLLYGLSCYIQHDLGHILRILCVLRPTLPLIRIESKDRWSPTNIPRLLTALLHWLSRGRLVQLGVIVNVLACGTGGGDIERYIRLRGVLGDIYKVEERGTAIGLFMGVSACASS